MSFAEMLASFVGRTVEVFLTNQFYTGQLLGANDCLLTIRTTNSYYYGPSTHVTLITDNVQFIRIINT